MQEACFIVSFDCEGKWGFADRINSYHHQRFTNYNLIKSYNSLLFSLETYNIKATFAFVAAFTLSFEEYIAYQHWFSDRYFKGKNWLAYFKSQVKDKVSADGWFCPETFNLVHSQGIHEIATHGFTHLPFDDALVTEETIIQELEGINAWQAWKQLSISTLVFPRNKIGFTPLLSKAGIQAYRDYPLYYHIKPRWAAEALKYIEYPISQPHSHVDQPIKIPGGNLLAFRRKNRFPTNAMIIQRWKSIIDHAVKHKQVVHLWMHPHNMIDGIDQGYLFDQVLAYAANYIKQGTLKNVTQQEYWSRL